MLYWLYQLTSFNILQYITVRAGIAFFVSFMLALFVLPKFIKWAKAKNANQPIYALAPKTHQAKSNTPTMGGLVFVGSTIFASILCVDLLNGYAIAGIVCILLFALIGIKDDLGKILGKDNQCGMNRTTKIIFQSLAGLIVALLLYFNTGLNSELFLPFDKYPVLSMELYAIAFWILVMVSTSNAVNLTDGLDGLATVPSIFSMISLSVFV